MKTSIFFAIPCGDFYEQQVNIIKRVCENADLDARIVEHSLTTSELWPTIVSEIERADYFVADISSMRPNILLELGFALREKAERRVGIFVSNNVTLPADLRGKKYMPYSGYANFQSQLIAWVVQVVGVDKARLQTLPATSIHFHDEFKDFDQFMRLWDVPSNCNFSLKAEGLRFSAADPIPIRTRSLGLLQDLEFEFTARIEVGAIGWVLKGTISDQGLPFCVMFNTDLRSLTPHVLDLIHPHPTTLWQAFPSVLVNIPVSKDGWFTITTKCVGDSFTISSHGNQLYPQLPAIAADFSNASAYPAYASVNPKQGQIGFRCHSQEIAIVRDVQVREI
ncbi:MAG: nucleotide-binding protein [Chloroflexi bacterium]|nr:nucleotide-binding protein [Chloroflexota bacterium]